MQYEIPSSDDRPIWDIWLAMYQMPCVTAALEVGLFETMAKGPVSMPELVASTGLNERGIKALLRILTALGLLMQHDDRYGITDVTHHFLLKDSPYYWGGVLERICVSNPQHKSLLEILRQGSTGSSAVGGESDKPADAWESGQLDIEQARHIAAFMHSHSMPAAVGVARNGDFTGVKKLLDVGGGSGCFSIAIAQQYPQIHCTIMDLAAMCQLVPDYVKEGAVEGRVDAVAVDMFRQEWPRGYDALFFSNILHDWSFETCAQLLARACSCLPEGGKIYLHEMLLDDNGNGPVHAAAFSIMMLIGTRGQQFTFPELRQLLQDAGFADINVISTHGYYSLVTAHK